MTRHFLLALAFTLAAPAAFAQSELDPAPLRAAIEKVLAEQRIPGAVVGVLHGDRLVFAEALGVRDLEQGLPMTTATLFQVGSVTKSFTATLLGILVDRGTVALDDPISAHLPERLALPATIGALTLDQLATHTSGLPLNPPNRRDLPDSPSVMLPYSVRELYEALRTTELQASPGSRASYSNYGFAVLGHVLECAAGKPYAELLRDEILIPLGMKDTGVYPSTDQESRFARAYWAEDEERVARPRWEFGEVAGFAGVFTSLGDLAKFVAAQYADGGGLLRPATRALLHAAKGDQPVVHGLLAARGFFTGQMKGLGSFVAHGGEIDGYSAVMMFLPEHKAGFVVLANLGGSTGEALGTAMLRQAPAWLPALSR
jgi:CubicO group peptidase (beta-lactamase class C family)